MRSPLGAGSPADSVRALLGPTNTGKTHRAIERMLEHPTGMIGLPLRLLAREVYDRVTAKVGEGAVALVTGEEKRVPPHPRYWVCTVEAMPDRIETDFLAIDEIQLAGHRERGHVFTDRLLHARGRHETWFLGADTMQPVVERLVPTAAFERRPRLSTLSDARSLTLATLPPRSAVVAFSAPRVYELAERLRARRGGAAIVLGALSPRARNAQIALYQAGEVDFLVATDAIGMGLNMDVDCVAFADLQKFDGRARRELDHAELAQIAGRAGRHTRDGRFATLAPLDPLPLGTVRAIERHQFAPQRRVFWRNRDLEFGSLEALRSSLRRPPVRMELTSWLTPVGDADDFRALERLAKDPDLQRLARGSERVSLLWRVCQIPDYRQLAMDDHFQLLSAIYRQLCGPDGRLPSDWIDRHVSRLDRPDGDLETLLARMAFVRTWTYVTHHTAWVEQAAHWQERARAIEDRLSDALHERLVQRFVDGSSRGRRRVATPRGQVKGGSSLADQLRDKLGQGTRPTVGTGQDGWIDELVDAPFERFAVDERGRIRAGSQLLARLGTGVDMLHPEVILLTEALGGGARLRLQRRLVAWSRDLVARLLAPLAPDGGDGLSRTARGLLYQLERGLGTAVVRDAPLSLRQLTSHDRTILRRLDVRVGRFAAYLPASLHPSATAMRTALVAAWLGPRNPLPPVPPGSPSVEALQSVPDHAYVSLGFPVLASRAVRADVAETLASRVAQGVLDEEIADRAGCSLDDAQQIRWALQAASRPHRSRTA